MLLFDGRQTPPLTVKKFRKTTCQPSCGPVRSDFALPVVSSSGPAPRSLPPDQSDSPVPVSCPLPLTSSGYDSSKKLSLTFNGHTFYMLSDVIAHIRDYPEGEARIALYVDVVKQASTIFDIGSAFAEGLIKAIKKDRSWAHAEWSTNEVEQLLAPLSRHVRAARTGRTRQEGALKTINRHWGPEVTAFFRSRNESEKTLRQLSHLSSSCFSYPEVRRLVNAHVVERILTGVSCHSSRYETTTCDWAALNKDNHVPDISFARLAAANLHYGAFGELVEGLLPSGLVSRFVAITHYGRYGELVEGPNPVATLKDHKEGGVDVDGKNGGVDADGKDVEDGEGDDEDFAMDTESVVDPDADVVNSGEADKGVRDTESVVDPDADVVNSGEADKGVGDTTSALLGAVGKGVGGADKGAGATTSDVPGEVGKDVGDQGAGDRISGFPGEVGKGVDDDVLANILVDVLGNPFGDLDSPSIRAAADLVNKLYTHPAIPAVVDTSAKPHTNPAIPEVIDTLAKPLTNPDAIFEEWSLCTSCSPSVVSAELWRQQICDCRDRGFLDGMYMLGCVKHMSLIVCNRHLHLLALNLYLADAKPAELRSRIDSIWDHRDRTADLTSFVYSHSGWFLNTLRFI